MLMANFRWCSGHEKRSFDYIVKGDDNDKIIPSILQSFWESSTQKKVQQLRKLNFQTFFDRL
jgi:hypothetical protein